MVNGQGDPYPVQYNVDYPDGDRNRLSALFRIVLAIPILVVITLVSGYSLSGDTTFDEAISPCLRLALCGLLRC